MISDELKQLVTKFNEQAEMNFVKKQLKTRY